MPFPVESDKTFAASVDPRAADLVLPGLPGVGSSTNPYRHRAGALRLLLAIGRVTAAIPGAKATAFRTGSHWAILRWFWAFESMRGVIRPSVAAKSIRGHHRNAFSEAAGLGVALLVTEQLAGKAVPPAIWTGGPLLIDVDSHLATGTRPDFIVLYGKPSKHAYVVEAKGNRSGRSEAQGQLRDGIDQVLAIGGAAKRLVLGVAATDTTFNAYGIEIRRPRSGAARISIGALANAALRDERNRLHRFAGLEDPLTAEQAEVFTLEDEGLEIVGRRFRLVAMEDAYEVTLGVERTILRGVDETETIEALAALRSEGLAQWRAHDDTHDDVTRENEPMAVVASDGCAFGLRRL
jgi:hypothetical protein